MHHLITEYQHKISILSDNDPKLVRLKRNADILINVTLSTLRSMHVQCTRILVGFFFLSSLDFKKISFLSFHFFLCKRPVLITDNEYHFFSSLCDSNDNHYNDERCVSSLQLISLVSCLSLSFLFFSYFFSFNLLLLARA